VEETLRCQSISLLMKIALIDGDIISYSVNWKYNTDYKKAWEAFRRTVLDLVDVVWADDYLLAVQGVNNYRMILYPDYKGHRKPNPLKTNFVRDLRVTAVEQLDAVPSDGMEADDLLRIWAREALEAGQEAIIVSGDKDLFMIPGKHYLIRSSELKIVTEEEAIRNFYEQLLKGDPTDNIPGLPGIGPIKAKMLLAECKTEEELKEKVKSCYQVQYKDAWKDYLLSNGKLIYIQKNVNDWFKI
jgi:5'-3' exonuclease